MDLLCESVLELMGWECSNCHPLFSEKKLVVVFPHTSMWDGFLAILFRLSYLAKMKNVKMAMWHTYYDLASKFFSKMGFIPVHGTGGFVKQVTDHLNKLDRFLFVISPEGQIAKTNKWRSGFYHIARLTGAKLAVINLNYMTRRMEYHGSWYPNSNYEKEIKNLEHIFSLVPPLNPEETNYARHFIVMKKLLHPFQEEKAFLFLVFSCVLFLFYIHPKIGIKLLH